MPDATLDNPILNSPYVEPARRWRFGDDGITTEVDDGRRPSSYFVPIAKTRTTAAELPLDGEWTRDRIEENKLINDIRERVAQWRDAGWKDTTPTTRRLLEHWTREDRERRLFFCQIEAVETAIYIQEVVSKQGAQDAWIVNQLREMAADANPGLFRVALKMATGTGKTVVMAMLVAWQTLNKVANRQDARFTDAFLVVCPGITIRDRLRVLYPEDAENYYRGLDIVPVEDRGNLASARIIVTNFHTFLPRETAKASKLTKTILAAGSSATTSPFTETADQVVSRVCRGFGKRRTQVMVLNDEAHHCYERRVGGDATDFYEGLRGTEKKEAQERDAHAAVWCRGVAAVHAKLGVKAVFDLSATPFFLSGSGYPEGTLFPWVVSDFSLIDAIESGLVKIPRVPVADDAGSSDGPTYRNLWPRIRDDLPKKNVRQQELVGEPKLPTELQGALHSLYGNYEKRYAAWAAHEEEHRAGTTPPVFIVVCANTSVSKLVYDYVSGWSKLIDEGESVLVGGELGLFTNVEDGRWLHRPSTILVDSAQLESGDQMGAEFKAVAAAEIERFKDEYRARFPGRSTDELTDEDLLREVMNTVGKPGRLGAHVRCVVSVSMLTEGWDANTVTHVLGVRAFGTQLLCEQVVGRGLRRRSYVVDERTGHFAPEYAEVYGVPFSFIPTSGSGVEPKPGPPLTRVRALVEREHLALSFPRVRSYRFDVPAEKLTADFTPDSALALSTQDVPSRTEMHPIVGEAQRHTLDDLRQRREQEVVFQIAKRVHGRYFADEPWAFPQLVRISRQWVAGHVQLKDNTFVQMLLLHELADRAADRVYKAVVRGAGAEERVRAVLSPYDRSGSTQLVDFDTAKPVVETDPDKSHVSHVVADGAEDRLRARGDGRGPALRQERGARLHDPLRPRRAGAQLRPGLPRRPRRRARRRRPAAPRRGGQRAGAREQARQGDHRPRPVGARGQRAARVRSLGVPRDRRPVGHRPHHPRVSRANCEGRSSMRGAKKGTSGPTPVEVITHQEKRANIPTDELRGFVEADEAAPAKLLYPRDTSLDPQLVWRGKDQQDADGLEVPVVPVYIQEKIQPRVLIENLRRTAAKQEDEPELALFDDFNGIEFEELVDFYQHEQNWTNRLILGDSLLVMASLAEKEGLRGKVQTIFFDPPYGIGFGSNFQTSTEKREVKDGKAADMTRQPEQIRAFRDTWKDGINSYLTYLRDRLVVARDLLNETGNLFVQIGDENVHLVRALMDEVFGRENFISLITFKKTTGGTGDFVGGTADYLVWYAKDRTRAKYRPLYRTKAVGGDGAGAYNTVQEKDGSRRPLNNIERDDLTALPAGARVLRSSPLTSEAQGRTKGEGAASWFPVEFEGRKFSPGNKRWKTNEAGMESLRAAERLIAGKSSLSYVRFLDDFPAFPITNLWDDTQSGSAMDKVYVVQTNTKVVQRCILMTTDPGDLVLDPTNGSGTAAVVAEEWGRRWIATDTSRVAIALTRTRLAALKLPLYLLADSRLGAATEAKLAGVEATAQSYGNDVRRGFVYKRVPHIMLKDIAQNPDIEPGMSRAQIDEAIRRNSKQELLFDQPYEDKKTVRVCGPFTVESLSPHRVISEDEAPASETLPESSGSYEETILANLAKAGVQNRDRAQRLDFDHLEPYAGGRWLHAAGEFADESGERRRVALSLGPEFGTVGPGQVKEAAKEAIKGVGFDLLLVLGFSFDARSGEAAEEFQPDEGSGGWLSQAQERRFGKLPVLLVKMNPDLSMGEDVLKATGAGNLFMVFGEPDVVIEEADDDRIEVEIRGVDVYDPTTGEVRSNTTAEIACWFVDTNYDGESFFVRDAYFTGANDPYKKLKAALKADIDEDAWLSLYRTRSRPFARPATGRIAIKVINHYGDEVLKVYEVA